MKALHLTARKSSMTTSCSNNRVHLLSTIPFYGSPSPPSTKYFDVDHDSRRSIISSPASNVQREQHESRRQEQRHYRHIIPSLTPLQRLGTLLHSSLTALNDPTRADAVAAVGEVTGSFALSKIFVAMEKDAVGRRILLERPLVDEGVAKRASQLLEQHINNNDNNSSLKQHPITFGAAYGAFLQTHNFHPNERSNIRFISDPNLAYVMTRYRQSHDFWHVLTGLPPTVLGELALKWLELLQTGLPLAALSATGGAMGVTSKMLSSRESEVLWGVYFPWAMRVGRGMRENAFMCTYYEEELETELDVLRGDMRIEEAPCVEL